jgi:hypothetical protein
VEETTKVKPSERFADLKRAAESMNDCQDKTDLLALFEMSDGLHLRVATFDEVVAKIKHNHKKYAYELKMKYQWLEKWLPLLDHMEQVRHEEKVVPLLQRARESDANV